MHLIPIQTPIVKKGDDLAQILHECGDIQDGDIVVVSSKAIAVSEGAAIDLSSLTVSDEAQKWSTETKRSPAFMQAVLDETKRLNGSVTGSCPGALLTELKPDGLKIGTILAPNAGMDESNITNRFAVGWPMDPVVSAWNLRKQLIRKSEESEDTKESKDFSSNSSDSLESPIGVIISDSCCRPRRLGVSAFALTVAGFDPLKSEIGNKDLFGKTMRVTVEASADQIATAANFLMGNTAQSIPAVIVRDHGIPFSDYSGWVDGIEPEEDLFGSMF